MPDRDSDTQRLFESVLYGTPAYHGIRTPDGRIVTEVSRLRQDEERRHGQLTRIQGDLVETLRSANRGSTTITRSDFDSRSAELLPAFREAAGRIHQLNQTQQDLLRESQALSRISSAGFTAVEDGLMGVRSDLHEVSSDIVQMDQHVTGAIQDGTRTLHGPNLPAESLTAIVSRGQLFFDALSAYSKRILTPEARREVEQLVDQRLRSSQAKAALRAYVDKKAEETIKKMRKDDPDEDEGRWHDMKMAMRRKGYALAAVIDRPSVLIGDYPDEAREQLAALNQISRHFDDQSLRDFVNNAYGLLSMYRKAAGTPVSGSFLVDLTNSGLVVDSVQHQVKQSNRGARLAGTDVDRNYNLMELLEQGDHASTQRTRMTEVAKRHLAVSTEGLTINRAALGQRDDLIQIGNRQVLVGVAGLVQGQEALGHLASIDEKISRRSANLNAIVANLSETNDHLVNLEMLGAEFIDVMEFGLDAVNNTLMVGFTAVVQGLDVIASEVSSARAAIVGQLRRIEGTIELSTKRVVAEVSYGNQQLERLVALQEGSLLNLAQQKLKQGQLFLKGATTPADFKEAAEIFKKGIDADPSFLENQFGLAVASEAYDDLEEAKKRYRNSGRLADDSRKEMAISSFQRLSYIQEKERDFPSAIESMRCALTKEPKSPTLRMGLARLLALTGMEAESSEVLLSLIEEDLNVLFSLNLNPAFSTDLKSQVYKEVLQRGGTSRAGLKAMLFLFDEFISFGEKDEVVKLFTHLLKFGPRHLLSSRSLEKLVGLNIDLKQALLTSSNTRSSEDWYATALIAYRLTLDMSDILHYFNEGLNNDITFQRGNRHSVKAFIEKLAKEHSSEFISYLIHFDSNLTWLNQP